jgi:carboxymethylenebutenolidase
VDHIKHVCERFAGEGFVALAPDLYHGKTTKSPDEAGKLLMELRVALGKKVEVIIYPNANHAFFNDTRPAVYHPEAAQDSWRRTLEFFRKHLS